MLVLITMKKVGMNEEELNFIQVLGESLESPEFFDGEYPEYPEYDMEYTTDY